MDWKNLCFKFAACFLSPNRRVKKRGNSKQRIFFSPQSGSCIVLALRGSRSKSLARGKTIWEWIGCARFLRKINILRLKAQGKMHGIAVNSHSRICRYQIHHCVVDYYLIRPCLKARHLRLTWEGMGVIVIAHNL